MVLRLIKLNPLYPDISMHCEHEYRRRGHKALADFTDGSKKFYRGAVDCS